MQRPGPINPRRTGDWAKKSFAPTPGKAPPAAPEAGASTTQREAPSGTLLPGREISEQMKTVPAWTQHGLEIRRRFHFDDFVGSMAFVQRVAELAEAAHHYPDIHIHWNKVTLTLTTHSEKGLTARDFDLARKIDGLVG